MKKAIEERTVVFVGHIGKGSQKIFLSCLKNKPEIFL